MGFHNNACPVFAAGMGILCLTCDAEEHLLLGPMHSHLPALAIQQALLHGCYLTGVARRVDGTPGQVPAPRRGVEGDGGGGIRCRSQVSQADYSSFPDCPGGDNACLFPSR